MKRIYPLTIVVFLGLIAVAVLSSNLKFGYYVSLPALIIVVGLPAAMLFATHSPGEMRAAFRAAYRSEDPRELQESIAFFKAAGRYLLWSGIVATMVGIVALLASLGDASHVGSAAALALITVLYSIVLNAVFALPFRHAAEKRLARFG